MSDLEKEIDAMIEQCLPKCNHNYIKQLIFDVVRSVASNEEFRDVLFEQGENAAKEIAERIVEQELYSKAISSMELYHAYSTNGEFAKWLQDYVMMF